MLHLQSPAYNWTQCLPHLAPGTVNKFFQTEACSEAKAIRPDCKTIKRHHVDHQDPYLYAEDKEQAARDFFSTFVDGTFRQHAPNIDYIESLNEIYAPDAGSQARGAAWDIAALKVWKTEYRTDPAYQHIKLIAANIAVGNDAPVSVAAACVQYDGVMGYHPYVPVKGKIILPDEYQHYSGRWERLDAKYRAAGHTVKWMHTETGAVGYRTPGVHLNGEDGWKHSDVYNGDFEAWLQMWAYWLTKVKAWNSANGNRVLGWQVFTSNQNPDERWRWFELQQPQMNSLAVFFKTFVPAPPPTNPPRRYNRFCHLVPGDATPAEWNRVTTEAYARRHTVMSSIDDAFITHPNLTSRTVVVWGALSRHGSFTSRANFEAWVVANYPPLPVIEYRTF